MVEGGDVLDVPRLWEAMRHENRNLGRPGVDSALAAPALRLHPAARRRVWSTERFRV